MGQNHTNASADRMPSAKILIVEDERIVAADLQGRLERMGYEILEVISSGAAAVEYAVTNRPDLVLMDITLRGGMDGVAAAEEMRRRIDVAVVYLTAHSDEATLQRAKITDPFGYVLKPFDERELLKTIEMALYKGTTDKRLREHQHWLSTTLQTINDAVITTDTEGRIHLFNPVAERVTGWTSERAEGLGIDQVCIFVNDDTRQSSIVPGDSVIMVSRTGARTHMQRIVTPIRDPRGATIGAVYAFRDRAFIGLPCPKNRAGIGSIIGIFPPHPFETGRTLILRDHPQIVKSEGESISGFIKPFGCAAGSMP